MILRAPLDQKYLPSILTVTVNMVNTSIHPEISPE